MSVLIAMFDLLWQCCSLFGHWCQCHSQCLTTWVNVTHGLYPLIESALPHGVCPFVSVLLTQSLSLASECVPLLVLPKKINYCLWCYWRCLPVDCVSVTVLPLVVCFSHLCQYYSPRLFTSCADVTHRVFPLVSVLRWEWCLPICLVSVIRG